MKFNFNNLWFIFLCLAIFTPIFAVAQIPNNSFTDWEIQGEFEVPSGWILNEDFCCSYVEKSTASETGDYALKVYSYFPQLEPFDWFIQTTFPVDEVHQNLYGKYSIDSLVNQGKAIMEVFQFLDGTFELIGSMEFTDKTSGYEIFNIELAPSPEADSFRIRITTPFSLISQMAAGYASITIDELELTDMPVSQNNIDFLIEDDLIVFPNPASTHIHLGSDIFTHSPDLQVDIIDVLGKKISSQQVTSMNPVVSIENLPNGVFYVRVSSDSSVLGMRKVMVVNQ